MASSDAIERRLRSHRLSAPAATLGEAAAHMLAVQSQDFAGGRWALALRTAGTPDLSAVDGAFAAGRLVRSWTMRGTLHIVPASDLRWVLEATGDRQRRRAAPILQREGIDDAELGRAEATVRRALAGGGRLTRNELAAAWEAAGIATAGQRAYHLLSALAVRGVLCLGHVIGRPGAVSREQTVILLDDLATDDPHPADPEVELFVRFLRGHGPATVRDAAWWSGLPLTTLRAAAARAGARIEVWADAPDPLYVEAGIPPSAAPFSDVIALPPFEEYYLSYADRTTVCSPEKLDRVGPSKNGMVRAVLVSAGVIVGTWTPARGADGIELFDGSDVSAEAARFAVARHSVFLAG
jgi:hypothetical protein